MKLHLASIREAWFCLQAWGRECIVTERDKAWGRKCIVTEGSTTFSGKSLGPLPPVIAIQTLHSTNAWNALWIFDTLLSIAEISIGKLINAESMAAQVWNAFCFFGTALSIGQLMTELETTARQFSNLGGIIGCHGNSVKKAPEKDTVLVCPNLM